MADFKVGEKVRFLHERQEGVVMRVISNKMLEVLVDDFVEMEVSVNEVVKIDSAESVFKREEEAAPEEEFARPRIELPASMAIITKGREGADIYLLNPTRDELLFSLSARLKHKYRGLNTGVVGPNQQRLAARLDLDTFDHATKIHLQILRHPTDDSPTLRTPFLLEISPKTDVRGQKDTYLDDLKMDGYRFVLEEISLPEAVIESTGSNTSNISAKTFTEVPEVVDLHIHKIVDNAMGMDAAMIFKLQLDHFDRKITDALMAGRHEIVFIHGIGDGTLKREIHQRLKGFAFVKQFSLADPLKYGNGATWVEIRSI